MAKTKKNKKLSTLLVVTLLALVAVGGMLAYLTSEDSDVNVMTLGNVSIDLIEQERDGNGGLRDFTGNAEGETPKELTPLVGSAQGEKDSFGMPKASNYVDKIVSVKNTGDSDAYVRVFVAVPAALEDAGALHWNLGNKYAPNRNYTSDYVNPDSEHIKLSELEDVSIDGIDYNTYEFTYGKALAKDEVIDGIFVGFYLDSAVNYNGKNYTINGNEINYDITKGVKIPVIAQAAQVAGFANNVTLCAEDAEATFRIAENALDTAFGNPDSMKVERNCYNIQHWFTALADPIMKDAKFSNNAESLVEALETGKDVVLTEDVKIDPAGMSNAYGKTGINVKNGQTIDGGGNILDIKGAGGTWDSGINTTGGTIKNITVTGSFRGIFINHNSNHSERVILDNVIIDGTVYTISCDQGLNQGLTATNSTFNGWTSYAATLGEAEFINCNFGEGRGYAYMRPYAPTEFVGCDFEEGFAMDARAAVTFENCTIGGVELTSDNLATLVTSNIANATVK